MLVEAPLVKGLTALAALLVLSFTQLLSLFVSPGVNLSITDWDGKNEYQGVIDRKQIVIYLEETEKPQRHGKVKIYFKDDKNKGTTLIYEREIGGEISDTDQEYIERILTNIEHFHKENRTYNQIRDKLDGFWKGLRRGGSR